MNGFSFDQSEIELRESAKTVERKKMRRSPYSETGSIALHRIQNRYIDGFYTCILQKKCSVN